MTIKGRINHYNVKFLKGYGFSIKVKDSKIVLKNNALDDLGFQQLTHFNTTNRKKFASEKY